jgi:hypothetical protein
MALVVAPLPFVLVSVVVVVGPYAVSAPVFPVTYVFIPISQIDGA